MDSVSEKGAGATESGSIAARRCSLFVRERSCDGRPLGLVNVWFLRGNQASHGPLAALALQATVALASSFLIHMSPHAVQERSSRHEASEAIGVGAKSLLRAVSKGNVEVR